MGSTVEELSPEGLELNEATIREAFNVAIAEMEQPLSRIAPLTGVNYQTLQAWKSGKYQGNNDRITAQVQQWLVTKEARQRMHIALPKAPGFVRTETARAILDVLEAAQTLPDIAIVSGAPGIGKTTSVQWYQKHAANVWVVTMEPAFRTLSAVLGEVSHAMGMVKVHSASFVSAQILRRAQHTGGLLIVDEAQHLSLDAVDQLRSLHDKAEIGIAMVGNETVAGRYGPERLTAEHAQLFSRVGQKFRQKGLKVRDLDMLITAWGLADEGARDVARKVGKTPGAARLMTKVLRMAFLLARGEDRDQPTQRDVKTAWEQLGAPEGGAA
jgi:DNA transposition AAA+ family ATPase